MKESNSVKLPGFDELAHLPTIKSLEDFESAFLERVYQTPTQRYVNRLHNVGLSGHSKVIDLGCGFGQWTLCLAQMNESVIAIDPAPQRVAAVKEIVGAIGMTNVTTMRAEADKLDVRSNSVNAVFCFGVAQYLDPARLMGEIARVLAPGGLVYINGKDVGGYVFDWLEGRHSQHDFDPRQCTVDAFRNSLALSAGEAIPEESLWADRIVPMGELASAASGAGLLVLGSGAEGSQRAPNVDLPADSPGFFPGSYRGLPNAYEIIATLPETLA